MEGTIFEAESHDTDARAVLHDEVQRKVLNEIRRVVAQRLRADKQNNFHLIRIDHLSVERMQHGVTGAISDGAATMGLSALAVVVRLFKEYDQLFQKFTVTRTCPPKARW